LITNYANKELNPLCDFVVIFYIQLFTPIIVAFKSLWD